MSNDATGLCVPFTIRVTPEKGQGVFADSAILKGTTVWCHVPGQYAVYDELSFRERLARMSYNDAVYELTHIHSVAEFPDYMVRVFDDGVLINHSAEPSLERNAGCEDYGISSVMSAQEVEDALLDSRFVLIAARNLEAGEELTLDYNDDPKDPAYYDALCDQYGVSWDWL